MWTGFPDPEAELDYSADDHPGAVHPHSNDCRPLIKKIVTERDAALKRLARGRSLDGSDLCLEDTGGPLFILVPGTSFFLDFSNKMSLRMSFFIVIRTNFIFFSVYPLRPIGVVLLHWHVMIFFQA